MPAVLCVCAYAKVENTSQTHRKTLQRCLTNLQEMLIHTMDNDSEYCAVSKSCRWHLAMKIKMLRNFEAE